MLKVSKTSRWCLFPFPKSVFLFSSRLSFPCLSRRSRATGQVSFADRSVGRCWSNCFHVNVSYSHCYVWSCPALNENYVLCDLQLRGNWPDVLGERNKFRRRYGVVWRHTEWHELNCHCENIFVFPLNGMNWTVIVKTFSFSRQTSRKL
jgi:hypothetical protein